MEIITTTKIITMNKNQNEIKRIGWMHNDWIDINKIKVSVSDRGITLGDGIFETILILNGKPKLLKEHLDRWHASAELLNMNSPPNETSIRSLLNDGIRRANLSNQNGSIRLNWSRGTSSIRGINIAEDCSNNVFWIEINPGEPSFTPISVIYSKLEKRNPFSKLSYCKTFCYGQSILAREEARLAGYDDAILMNTNDKICCGTTANLIVKVENQIITPPLSSGCLPGIMRQQGINKGIIQEADIDLIPKSGEEWLLINSLGCQHIKQIDGQNLKIVSNPRKLWQTLLLEK